MRISLAIAIAVVFHLAALPARADEIVAWPESPLGPIAFAGRASVDGVTSSFRDGTVTTGGVTYRADAAFCSYVAAPGDHRQAIMIRSSAVPLASLLPAGDRFLGPLFADAAPGAGSIASSSHEDSLQAFELRWVSQQSWLIDTRDSIAFDILKELVAEPAVFAEWDFSQFLVESSSVQVRRVENVYDAEEARSFFAGTQAEDRSEFVASIVLEGTMPAAQGMFRWLRTRVRVHVPNFPIRLVNARMTRTRAR